MLRNLEWDERIGCLCCVTFEPNPEADPQTRCGKIVAVVGEEVRCLDDADNNRTFGFYISRIDAVSNWRGTILVHSNQEKAIDHSD
jgi:hypothetical protein